MYAAPDYVRAPTVATLPQRISENRYGSGAGLFVVGGEAPSDSRLLADQVEEIRADPLSQEGFRQTGVVAEIDTLSGPRC
jgi:hypothetical protein